MHIHAQTEVDLDGTEVLVLRGSDQHAAIATSITISIATSITISTPPLACFELSGCGGGQFYHNFYHNFDQNVDHNANPSLEHVWSYRDVDREQK